MRLIDADALVERICGKSCGCHRNECGYTYDEDGCNSCSMVREIEDTHTIDVQPVQMGERKKGAIITGYQGIGKSTLAGNKNGYIDLESGNFFVDGKRDENWFVVYGKIALNLAQQGYRVFISSHSEVRKWIAEHHKLVPIYACFPSFSLKHAWISKLKQRWKSSQLDKDYKAWQNAECRFDESIKELHEANGFIPIVIHDTDYSLEQLIDAKLVYVHC